MLGRKILVQTTLASLVVLTASITLLSAPESDAGSEAFRIGVNRTLFQGAPEAMIEFLSRPLRSLMEAETGIAGKMVLSSDANQLAQQLAGKKVQLGVLHGIEFAWARQKFPDLKPLVIVVNEYPVCKVHVVVKDECKAASFADLKGLKVALPRTNREHCNVFLDRRCQNCGLSPKDYFGAVAGTPDIEEAFETVLEGKADAAVVDDNLLEYYRWLKPGRCAKLRSVVQSEAFPGGVLAYQPGAIDDDLVQRLRESLLSAHQNRRGQQLLKMCRIASFRPSDAAYEQLLTDILKSYPPPDSSVSK